MAPSLYIHIPFCKKKCLYCDFYSTTYQKKLSSDYVEALIKQIRQIDAPVSSIYIGGGTPSVLGVNLLGPLLKSLKKIITPGIEFTIEVNPESFSKKSAELFLENGINRLSIGLQSFDQQKLRKLGRIHNAKTAQEAVYLAKNSGFKNISIDLIFGVWDEEFPDWKKELQKAVSLPVKHISVYSLTYEKSTPLSKMLKKGLLKPLEDEAVARMYEYAIDFLEERGFSHYEVSNFALGGYICRHNFSYWQNEPYIGLGPSAVSYVEGRRKRNISDTGKYIAKVKRNEKPFVFQEKLSPEKAARETSALKIRTSEGINLDWFRKKTGFDFLRLQKEPLTKLLDEGLIEYKRNNGAPDSVCLSKKGFLFCDSVSSEFL